VSPIVLAAAVVAVAAAIACVSARSAAVVAIAAAVLLGVTPLLADPGPAGLVLLERAVGAALAGEFLWLGLRGRRVGGASALGWLPLAFLAAAAFAAGVGVQRSLAVEATSGVDTAGAVIGSAEAFGAAFALAAVALTAVARRSDGVQLGISALVLIAAASVARIALAGAPTALETLLVAGLGLAIAAAVTLLVPQIERTPRPTAAPWPSGDAADGADAAGPTPGPRPARTRTRVQP